MTHSKDISSARVRYRDWSAVVPSLFLLLKISIDSQSQSRPPTTSRSPTVLSGSEASRSPSSVFPSTIQHQKRRWKEGATVDLVVLCLSSVSFSDESKAGEPTSPCLAHSSHAMQISALPRLARRARRQVRTDCHMRPSRQPFGRGTSTCDVRKIGQSTGTEQPESLTAVFS